MEALGVLMVLLIGIGVGAWLGHGVAESEATPTQPDLQAQFEALLTAQRLTLMAWETAQDLQGEADSIDARSTAEGGVSGGGRPRFPSPPERE